MRRDLVVQIYYFLSKHTFLDQFEETHFKEKMLVEKVGTQTQTSSKDPFDLNLRRTVVGPNLYFCADGSLDPNPIHYWGSVIENKFYTIN